MKKQFLTLLGSALLLSGQSQENSNLLPCNTYQAMEEAFKANPNLKLKYDLAQAEFDIQYQAKQSQNQLQRTAATTYSIPVVFHVMGPQNIPDQVFIDAIDQVNRDYGRRGSDTASIYPNFKSIYVSADMVFVLAKRDPNGNCTNGIIRHDNESMYWNQQGGAYNYSGTGTNRWPRERYLNVYIVSCIYSNSQGITCPTTGGSYLGGYTYVPGSSPGANSDAIVYRTSELAGTRARALSHEIGHWFNLQHTFGSTNNPGTTCGDDGVADTPPTKGILSQCPSSAGNTCSGSGNLWNVENFMDYSSCPKNFTSGQVLRMRTAAESNINGSNRQNLWSAANMIATGLSGTYTCAPVAQFESNKRSVCVGNTITYTNESFVGNSGNVSWIFEGGSPATSTANAPVVTYATPGTYSVSLTATNASGTNTKNQTSYVTVVQGGAGALVPRTYDFEAGNFTGITIVNNNSGSVAWDINNSTGANGTSKSIFLNNASQTNSGAHVDYFETEIYDFTNTTNITFSYYYAYAKKVTAQADSFKVQYSLDCGGSWVSLLGVPNMNTMATGSGAVTASAFTPTQAQWKQINLSTTILSAVNNKPSVKFRFWFKSDAATGSSNNIFIDQINLSGTVGLNELEKSLDMMLYPNPTNGSSTIDFNTTANSNIRVSVMDVVGRVVEEASDFNTNGNRTSYVVNKNSSLAKGVYFINVYAGDQKVSKKLIIQ